jgi:hypothetical protein
MKLEVYAMYLPQYHVIKENSSFWGEDYTDWVAVKQATPVFNGHIQPKIPLNNCYYDLSKKESIIKQVELAKNYEIDGFCIYHYWFYTGKILLEKPAEILLHDKSIAINFFFAWDNGSWKRTWSKIRGGNDWAPLQDSNKSGPQVLVKYDLGEEKDWLAHFDYLLPFFKDGRYKKINNSPVFLIFNYSKEMEPMIKCWQRVAKANGFNGIYFIFRFDKLKKIPKSVNRFLYEPQYSGWSSFGSRFFSKVFLFAGIKKLRILNYDKVWSKIIKHAKRASKNCFSGAFVAYDDTPRRGYKGTIIQGASPTKFKKYISALMQISEKQNKPFIFLTAWNEWGEGAYLEPDTLNKYDYLEAFLEAKK